MLDAYPVSALPYFELISYAILKLTCYEDLKFIVGSDMMYVGTLNGA